MLKPSLYFIIFSFISINVSFPFSPLRPLGSVGRVENGIQAKEWRKMRRRRRGAPMEDQKFGSIVRTLHNGVLFMIYFLKALPCPGPLWAPGDQLTVYEAVKGFVYREDI